MSADVPALGAVTCSRAKRGTEPRVVVSGRAISRILLEGDHLSRAPSYPGTSMRPTWGIGEQPSLSPRLGLAPGSAWLFSLRPDREPKLSGQAAVVSVPHAAPYGGWVLPTTLL